ncbi:hypothetical protein MBLNU230_g3354t1 [Neophaeotheca triangularis]
MDGRRTSHSGRGTPTRENPNVFDDEFEEDDFDGFGIADGFRPGDDERDGAMGGQHPPVTSVLARYANTPLSAMDAQPPSRDSTRKVRPEEENNPFASPEDGPLDRSASMTSHGTSQFAPGITHRLSSASSHDYARGGSPFGAVDGPSHPYGMYAQGTIPRSPSVATTVQQTSSERHSRDGPTHPYALYPQGVDADADHEVSPQNPVPVGFPGLGQSYQRRLGPDGEEQDIIGADGHMEQLPPYSRYPEDGPSKPLLASLDVPPPVAHSRGPVAGNDPGMPLMHEVQQAPVPQSMTDDSRLNARRNLDRSPSMPNLERMNSDTSSGNSASTKKSWSEKSWKEKRNTRVVGVPLWWILLAGGVLAFVTVAIGSAIGGFLGTQKGEDEDDTPAVNVTVVSTSLYDASIIATPASSLPPTGTYALTLSTPQETQAGCLANQDYAAAWSCDLAGVPAAAVKVGTAEDEDDSPVGASLYYASESTEVEYGTQRQVLMSDFAPFLAVSDNDNPENGPAFYFQAQYNKVVVLPENAFDQSSKSKRQAWSLPDTFSQKQVIDPGEKPWFCYWNNTLLEGYIYVQQPVAGSFSISSSVGGSSSSPTVAASAISAAIYSATAGASITASPTAVVSGARPSTSTSSSSMDALAEALAATSATLPVHAPLSTSPESTQLARFDFEDHLKSKFAEKDHQDVDDDDHNHDEDDDSDESDIPRKRSNSDEDGTDKLPIYPLLVKLEERRLPNNPDKPFCQQFQILDNGKPGEPLTYSDGSLIKIELEENDPEYGAFASAPDDKLKPRVKRAMVPGGCHCQWMSGQ